MSKRNGDKARFSRLRKRKILLRKTIREFRAKLENGPSGPTLPEPELVGITSLTAEPTDWRQ